MFQEGSVQKSSGGAPGGSHGAGKNAVLNVSDLRTVFYSTRCLELGRMEKLQGKATLMTHPDPKKNEQLQHIGFFAMPGVKPILGKAIPDIFLLNDMGAGVFIMGFNPRSEEWAKEVTSAVIENFFYAIHREKLVVKVSVRDSEETVIDRQTLDLHFQERQDRPAYHYYKAITITEDEVKTTEPIGDLGPLDVHISLNKGPRRTAYVNRNGMLITDSREQRANPIAPVGNNLWPNFAVVVIPATDDGDLWIRKTENPSHDPMSPGQLQNQKESRKAQRLFKGARSSIRGIVDKAAAVGKYGDRSNLDELASMLPDEFDPGVPGNIELKATIDERQIVPPTPPLEEEDIIPGPESAPDPGPGPGPEPGPGPGPTPGPGPGTKPTKSPTLKSPQFIQTSPTTATVAFTVTEDLAREVKVRLMPAGGEYAREKPVWVTEAVVLSPKDMKVSLEDGTLKIAPRQNERIAIQVTTNGSVDNLAVRIG